MFKKIFILLFFLASFQGCNRSNPVSEDNYPPPDPATEKVVDLRIGGDPYGDTIKTKAVVDTINDTASKVDSLEVDFLVDIKNSHFGINGGLSKISLNSDERVKLRDYRIDSINAITLEFASLDSKDTIQFNFPVVNGTCAVTMVRIPSGHTYQVLVSLWQIKKSPWANYNITIYCRSFSALDSVNLKAKSKDTLNLTFYESVMIKYFFGLKNPPGAWTEGKDYFVYTSFPSSTTPAFYKGGTLYGYYVMSDLRSKSSSVLTLGCDTGKILCSFLPNLMTMLSNSGVVMVGADSIWLGVHETHEDTLAWVSLDGAPQHPY
jgi:hypothetical protein